MQNLFFHENNPRLAKLLKMWEQNTNDTFLTYAIGMEYLGMNQTEQAEIWFCRTLDLDENHVPSYFRLGQLMADIDNTNEAIRWLEEGIEVAITQNDKKAQREMQALLDELLS